MTDHENSVTDDGGVTAGRAWLASLPAELAGQRRVLAGLLDFCEATPLVSSLSVGCSLGRGAADRLSDIDAALGVAASPGDAGAREVLAVEAGIAAAAQRCQAVLPAEMARYVADILIGVTDR